MDAPVLFEVAPCEEGAQAGTNVGRVPPARLMASPPGRRTAKVTPLEVLLGHWPQLDVAVGV